MVYEEQINKLKEEIIAYLKRKKVNAPEEKMEKFARAMATNLFLSAEYGAGDALAGMMLKKMCSKGDLEEASKVWIGQLKKLGVKNLPEPIKGEEVVFGYVKWRRFWDDIMEKADFGDERFNKILRRLGKYSKSGGSFSYGKVFEQ